MVYLLEMVIFYSYIYIYVSLPEGKPLHVSLCLVNTIPLDVARNPLTKKDSGIQRDLDNLSDAGHDESSSKNPVSIHSDTSWYCKSSTLQETHTHAYIYIYLGKL